MDKKQQQQDSRSRSRAAISDSKSAKGATPGRSKQKERSKERSTERTQDEQPSKMTQEAAQRVISEEERFRSKLPKPKLENLVDPGLQREVDRLDAEAREAEEDGGGPPIVFGGPDIYQPRHRKNVIDDAMLDLQIKNYIRSIAMDTYQPLAKKVIGNLNVIAEMRVEVTNMKNEFRAKMFSFEQEIKPLSKIEWVKEELLKTRLELKQEIHDVREMVFDVKQLGNLAIQKSEQVGHRVDANLQRLSLMDHKIDRSIETMDKDFKHLGVKNDIMFKEFQHQFKQVETAIARVDAKMLEDQAEREAQKQSLDNVHYHGLKVEGDLQKITTLQQRDYSKRLLEIRRECFDHLMFVRSQVFQQIFEHVDHQKQKLLFQIGILDDPWNPTDDYVEDQVYSEDSDSEFEYFYARRSRSFDRFTGFDTSTQPLRADLIMKRKKRSRTLPRIHKINEPATTMICRQKKYPTHFDKRDPDEFDEILSGLRKKDRTAWKQITGKAFLEIKFGKMQRTVKRGMVKELKKGQKKVLARRIIGRAKRRQEDDGGKDGQDGRKSKKKVEKVEKVEKESVEKAGKVAKHVSFAPGTVDKAVASEREELRKKQEEDRRLSENQNITKSILKLKNHFENQEEMQAAAANEANDGGEASQCEHVQKPEVEKLDALIQTDTVAPLSEADKARLFSEEKRNFAQETVSFIRAHRRGQNRERRLATVIGKNRRRKVYNAQVDKFNRYKIERRGPEQLQPNYIDPHRVQVFSFEEIWKGVLSRLVELRVLKDPDHISDDDASSDTSEEYSNWDDAEEDEFSRPMFDFVGRAKQRFGNILRGQTKQRKRNNHPTVEDQMRPNDFIIINKAILKTAEHETFKHNLMRKNIFHFIDLTNEHRETTEERLANLEKEAEEFKQREREMKESYLPQQFEEYRVSMIKDVIDTVNSMNGGPVTEGKVLEMLETERQTNIKADIDVLRQKVDVLVELEIQKIIEKLKLQQVQIDDAKVFAVDLDQRVVGHQAQFDREEVVPEPMREEDEKRKGIQTRFGMKFDKDGNIMQLTKKQMVNQLYDNMVTFQRLEEAIRDQARTNESQEDQIKAFNKKLANGKTDNQMMLEIQKKDFKDEILKLKKSLRDFEQKLMRNLDKMGGGEVPSEPSMDRTGIGYDDHQQQFGSFGLIDSAFSGRQSSQRRDEDRIQASATDLTVESKENAAGLSSWESQKRRKMIKLPGHENSMDTRLNKDNQTLMATEPSKDSLFANTQNNRHFRAYQPQHTERTIQADRDGRDHDQKDDSLNVFRKTRQSVPVDNLTKNKLIGHSKVKDVSQTNYNRDLTHLPKVHRPDSKRIKPNSIILKGQQVNRHASQGFMPQEQPEVNLQKTQRMLAALPQASKTRSKFLDYASGFTPSSTTFYDSKGAGKRAADLKMPNLESKRTTLEQFTKGVLNVGQSSPKQFIKIVSHTPTPKGDVVEPPATDLQNYGGKTANNFYGINNNKSIRVRPGVQSQLSKTESVTVPSSIQADLKVKIGKKDEHLENARIAANLPDRSKSALDNHQPLGIQSLVGQAQNQRDSPDKTMMARTIDRRHPMKGISHKYNSTTANIQKALERKQILSQGITSLGAGQSPVSTTKQKNINSVHISRPSSKEGTEMTRPNGMGNRHSSMNLKITMTPGGKQSGASILDGQNRDIENLLQNKELVTKISTNYLDNKLIEQAQAVRGTGTQANFGEPEQTHDQEDPGNNGHQDLVKAAQRVASRSASDKEYEV